MPWSTPTLAQVRQQNRDYLVGKLGVPIVPNSVARVLADANGGNAHLALQYLDWLSLQLLPDTAETVFLDKWANIFLVNADGSRGRKQATFASGTMTLTGLVSTVVPSGTGLTGPGTPSIGFETTTATTIGTMATPISIRALDAGSAGNLDPGTGLFLSATIVGIDSQSATVVSLTGGTDEETDDELRIRVLARIRQPPMGGDGDDWVNWTFAVAGVTRAWCSPNEVSVGTVTVRFMCDDLRASNQGLPTADDIAAVTAFLDSVRPVTVKEFFVVAPTLQPVNFQVANLVGDTVAARAAIAVQAAALLKQRAKPAYCLNGVAQPPVNIPAAWMSEAVYVATNGASFDLVMADAIMANAGCMATLGTIG